MNQRKKRNVLISAAGKRGSLLKICSKELKSRYPEAMVIATDMCPSYAPAAWLADESVQVPKINDPDYISVMQRLCKEKGIGMIIPTLDTELLVLAQYRQEFLAEGTEVIVSDFDVVSQCRDKRLTHALFTHLGMSPPKLMSPDELVYPVFCKPYDGSLSAHCHIVNNPHELNKAWMKDPKLIWMEYIDQSSYDEYTVDMYYDRVGKIKSIVPRKRLVVRAGEINKGITIKNSIIDYLYNRMGNVPGMRGVVCVQLFYQKDSGDIIPFEINARFAGGYPLTYYAGANYLGKLFDEYFDEKLIKYDDYWDDQTMMLRYDAEVIIKENKLVQGY